MVVFRRCAVIEHDVEMYTAQTRYCAVHRPNAMLRCTPPKPDVKRYGMKVALLIPLIALSTAVETKIICIAFFKLK